MNWSLSHHTNLPAHCLFIDSSIDANGFRIREYPTASNRDYRGPCRSIVLRYAPEQPECSGPTLRVAHAGHSSRIRTDASICIDGTNRKKPHFFCLDNPTGSKYADHLNCAASRSRLRTRQPAGSLTGRQRLKVFTSLSIQTYRNSPTRILFVAARLPTTSVCISTPLTCAAHARRP